MTATDATPDDTVLVWNRCAWACIDARYRPLVAAVEAAYGDVFAGALASVWLLGSVPRGEAITGASDLDALALVRRGVAAAHDELLRRAAQLARAHPVVSRVDLDVSPVDGLTAFQRFVLSSDALCLSGRDTRTRPLQALPRGYLARLVTPDLGALVVSYRRAARQLDAAAELRFYARVTGKDLLKGLRAISLLRGGAYERSSDRIYHQAVALVPEHAELAGELYRLYRRPDADREGLPRVLAAAEERLLPDLASLGLLGARGA